MEGARPALLGALDGHGLEVLADAVHQAGDVAEVAVAPLVLVAHERHQRVRGVALVALPLVVGGLVVGELLRVVVLPLVHGRF